MDHGVCPEVGEGISPLEYGVHPVEYAVPVPEPKLAGVIEKFHAVGMEKGP